MADFIKIADRVYEGASTDTKPTGIPWGTLAKETDTLMTYITYDHGVSWVLTDNELYNIAVLNYHIHSRMRVYPQNVGNTITLACAGTVNTFGSWTEIVPIDTIDFMYMVKGVVIEAANAAATYLAQLGYSIVDDTDPVTAGIIGERRLILPTPIPRATEILEIAAMHCPANAKLWGRVKSGSGDADELEVSVVVIRHLDITNHLDHLTTWPWST